MWFYEILASGLSVFTHPQLASAPIRVSLKTTSFDVESPAMKKPQEEGQEDGINMPGAENKGQRGC